MNANSKKKQYDKDALENSLESPAPKSTQLELKENTNHSVDAIIALVGKRVRAARKEAGLSRRVLSELSGVSQRYLALLESGEGNISIGLLSHVAIALDRSIESFLIEDNMLSIEASRITALYRSADSDTRTKIQRILDPAIRYDRKAQRICLVGLRGAGKSSLGALTGKEFKLPFLELNHQIEQAAGMPIAEVIALYGPEGYRKLEAESLHNIIESKDRLVLAVAGGVVLDNETFSTLLSRFNTIWIKASPAEHMDRVRAQGDMRPMENNPQAMEQLRQILKNRESMYQQADYHLDTTGKSLNQSQAELSRLIASGQMMIDRPD